MRRRGAFGRPWFYPKISSVVCTSGSSFTNLHRNNKTVIDGLFFFVGLRPTGSVGAYCVFRVSVESDLLRICLHNADSSLGQARLRVGSHQLKWRRRRVRCPRNGESERLDSASCGAVMTTETGGRRASRLELLRTRLHEPGRRCAPPPPPRDGDVTPRTPTTGRPAARPPGRDVTTAAQNGIRPVPRATDTQRRRTDAKPDRKMVQSGNTNHDRQTPGVARLTEVKPRSKLESSVDRDQYAQVRKPAGRVQVGVEGKESQPSTAGRSDATVEALPNKTLKASSSSSSSLLSRSQNFFARLRSRKNDPTKTSKSTCADGGSGNENGSKRKIRRSISESGCTMYADRGPVAGPVNQVDRSCSSTHLDVVMSSSDVTTERQTAAEVSRPITVSHDVGTDDMLATGVYAEVGPSTSRASPGPDVGGPTESTSGSVQADPYSLPTATYEECAGSYSLREALMRRGGEAAEPADAPRTSMSPSDIIRPDSTASAPQPNDDYRAQGSSLLPVGCAASSGARSTSLLSWRRHKMAAGASSSGVGGGRLERIQEVDSPPGSADDNVTPLRPVTTEQRVEFDITHRQNGDPRKRKFTLVARLPYLGCNMKSTPRLF